VKIADQKNVLAGLLYLLFGIAVAVGATHYPIGTSANMGAGYFPLGVGVLLAITGLCVLGTALAQRVRTTIGFWPLRNAAIVLASVVLFALLLEPLGLIVAVPVLLGASAMAHPDFSWRAAAVSMIVLLPLTWALFVVLLGLQFPLLPSFLTE
jgi:hypothetical protein